MMQFETFFLLFCRAKHVRLVEAEQMPLSPSSKTWQNISRALILATKLESFQKLQLRNGKCYFEKFFKVILQCLFKVMTSLYWTCFKVFFVQRCIFKKYQYILILSRANKGFQDQIFFYYSTFSGGGSRCQNALFYCGTTPSWQVATIWHRFLLLAAEIKISLNITAKVAQHNTTDIFHLSFTWEHHQLSTRCRKQSFKQI